MATVKHGTLYTLHVLHVYMCVYVGYEQFALWRSDRSLCFWELVGEQPLVIARQTTPTTDNKRKRRSKATPTNIGGPYGGGESEEEEMELEMDSDDGTTPTDTPIRK